MNQKRVLVVSSANIDFVMRVGSIPQSGQTVVETRSYEYVPGGKGANSALTLAKLGSDCVFCTRLGNDSNADRLQELYEENGIDTRFICRDRELPTGLASIIVEDSGANRIVVYPGANSKISPDDVENALTCLPDALFLHFEIPEDAVITATKLAEKKNIPVVIDAGPARADYPLEKLGRVEIFSPNETETQALTGIIPSGTTDCLRAAIALKRRVDAKYIVIKLGARGAFIYDGTYSKHVTTYECEAIDTTAAGDAFTAAMTLQYLKTYKKLWLMKCIEKL